MAMKHNNQVTIKTAESFLYVWQLQHYSLSMEHHSYTLALSKSPNYFYLCDFMFD